jgi:hypothetical protein
VPDLSQHKTLFTLHPGTRLPKWVGIPGRVLFFTILGGLLSFAITLLLAIIGTAAVSLLRGLHPDMRIAYREIALPVAAITAAALLVTTTVLEIRNYRRGKTLEAIERMS